MIVILGGSGYVGSAFVRFFESKSIDYLKVSRLQCDYYKYSSLKELLLTSQARYLINAAGYTGKPNVDACESVKDECILANTHLPYVIGRACEVLDVRWGQVGSGCIYQGNNGGKGFSELDPPNFSFRQNNCSFYSGTKALAEQLTNEFKECYQWRMRIPFDHHPTQRNYITKVLKYETLLEVENSFAHLDQYVEACYYSLINHLPTGIWNMTNHGSLTTSDVVRMVAGKLTDRTYEDFQFFFDESDFMKKAAITPRSSCVLNTKKARDAGLPLDDVDVAFEKAIAAYEVSK